MPKETDMAVPHDLLILGAAVKTGMIKALEKKAMSHAELAEELKADARAVWVVVEALAALGYLTKEGELFALSEETRKMMYDPDAPNYTGFAFMHRYNLIRSWVHLPEVIATGKPHPRERGSENTSYFMAAMRHNAKLSAPSVAEFLMDGAGAGTRVLDIGGGPLVNARAFAARGASVTVLDLPEVVEMMNEEATAGGIKMVPGDFNVGLPPGPFDLAYLGNICHIFGERENRELFRKVAEVLVPGGRIAIADFVRDTIPFAAVFGVNMLVNTANGGTWTLAQYAGWLEEAGFGGARLDNVSERQLITAVKN